MTASTCPPLEQLVAHGLAGADQAVRDGLIQDDPQVGRVGPVEDTLRRQPGGHELVDCIPTRIQQSAEEQRPGVVSGLEQAGG
jgi:hypothetical protein